MYASKSFCNVEVLIANAPGTNSSVGELTTYAQTFTRELGVYQDVSKPGYTVFNFKSADDTPAVLAMDPAVVTQAVGLTDFCVNEALTIVGQIFADQLLTQLIAYGADKGISQISIGEVRLHETHWLPDWIKWSSDAVTGANENTIWIAIDSFISQYTDFDIVIVPPIDPLDLFFTAPTNVVNLIGAITVPSTMDRIQLYSAGNPYTILRADEYDWINPVNSAQHVPVNWPVLIYGPAGNNIDAIKDALVTYILANSTHSRAEWTAIFPDIFKRTEFIMAPHWQHYAIPNMTLQQGIYSAIASPTDSLAYLKLVANQYLPAHIDANACIMAHPYRSLMVSTIGSAENRDSLFRLDVAFPDYIDVNTSTGDFSRMSPETQAWVLIISNLIIVAESMTEFTSLPAGMMKMSRDGVLYVVQTYNNVQYLVASKASIYALLGISMT